MSYSKLNHQKTLHVLQLEPYNSALGAYSSLSKKPADLTTTDIELSAIRIFLADGSHRTLSCAPDTTCGELVDQLLEKLGLGAQRNEHSLQIKYQFSAPRVVLDGERVAELNEHVWDTIERVYLCRITAPPIPIKKKKRLATFDSTDSSGDDGIYRNSGVAPKMEPDTTDLSAPVLVNEKLANNFARAWNEGESKEEEGIRIPKVFVEIDTCDIDRAYSLPQCTTLPQYTLERPARKKQSILQRQTPVNSSTDQQTLPRKRKSKTPEHTRKKSITSPAKDHFTLPTSPGVKKNRSFMMMAEKRRSMSCDDIAALDIFSGTTSPTKSTPNVANFVKKFDMRKNKSSSEECLLTVTDGSARSSREPSAERDSGYQESDAGDSSPNKHGSLFEISCKLTSKSRAKSTSSPCLNRVHITPPPEEESTETRSTLISAISMELLTGKDIQTIADKLQTTESIGPQIFDSGGPPAIPERSSACAENCTVSDHYLLSQGKRLSALMNIHTTPNKKDRGHLKNLFGKFGTLLKKGKGSSHQKAQTGGKKCLGYPDSPAPTHTQPPKQTDSSKQQQQQLRQEEKTNSQGVKWSQVVYDHVIASPTPTTSSSSVSSSSNTKFTVKGSTEKLSPKQRAMEGYDVVVPAPRPKKNPYLTVVSIPDIKPEYANPQKKSEEGFYKTPSPQSHSTEVEHHTLHIYNSPSNSTPGSGDSEPTTFKYAYENNEIKGTKSGIALGAANLHVYQVPGEVRSPLPPLPPKPGSSSSSSSSLSSNSTFSPFLSSPGKPLIPIPVVPPCKPISPPKPGPADQENKTISFKIDGDEATSSKAENAPLSKPASKSKADTATKTNHSLPPAPPPHPHTSPPHPLTPSPQKVTVEESRPHTFAADRENIYEDMGDGNATEERLKRSTPSQKIAKLRSYGSTPEFIPPGSSVNITKQPLPSKPVADALLQRDRISEIYETIPELTGSFDEYVDMNPLARTTDGVCDVVSKTPPPPPPPKPTKSVEVPQSSFDIVLTPSVGGDKKMNQQNAANKKVPILPPSGKQSPSQQARETPPLQSTSVSPTSAAAVPSPPPPPPPTTTSSSSSSKPAPVKLPPVIAAEKPAKSAPIVVQAKVPLFPKPSKQPVSSLFAMYDTPRPTAHAMQPSITYDVPNPQNTSGSTPVSMATYDVPNPQNTSGPTPVSMATYDVPNPQNALSVAMATYDVPNSQNASGSTTVSTATYTKLLNANGSTPVSMTSYTKLQSTSSSKPVSTATYNVPKPQKSQVSNHSVLATPPTPPAPPPPRNPGSPPPPPPPINLKPRSAQTTNTSAMATSAQTPPTASRAKPQNSTPTQNPAQLFNVELLKKLQSRQVD